MFCPVLEVVIVLSAYIESNG